jgi:Zn-dependent protease with chaperone function
MMSPSFVSDIGIAIVAGLLAVALVSAGISAGWPGMQRLLVKHDPRSHGPAILLYSSVPYIAGLTLFVSCLAVSLSAGFDVVPEHCHADISGRNCVPHEPLGVATLSPVTVLIIVAGTLFAIVLSVSRRYSEYWRNLLFCARYDSKLGAHVVEAERPFVFCAGLLRHRVFASTALIKMLDSKELQIVLSHEHHHARCRHGAWLFVVQILSGTLWPSVRREMVSDFHVAIEHSCDRFASTECGDRFAVASTLLKLQRVSFRADKRAENEPAPADHALSMSIFGGSLNKRITWLVDAPPAAENDLRNVLGHLVGYTVVAAIMAAEFAHMVLESAFIQLID